LKAAAPTKQQLAAIEARDVSVALSAGAGCGKTSVLTQRFLSHLEPGDAGDELSTLVAITFTERAAREMRDRIRAECRARLRAAPAADAPHWQALVRELDSARIGTIHGFCASLLRSHAVEAGIDPLFRPLDEALADSFLSKGIRGGLHALLGSNDPDAEELVFELGLARTEQVLASLVTQRYRIDFSQWENVTAEELARRWDERWHAEAVPWLLQRLGESALATTILDLLRQHVPENRVMRERREELLEQIPKLAGAADPAALIESLVENARVQGGGNQNDWESEEVYFAVRDALGKFREELKSLQKQLDSDPASLLRGAEIGMCALRVTERVGRIYDERKAEASLLDFDDLLLLARNLLRDHDDVRRRAAAGIRLLMVDEFQDTDPIQNDIVRLLCGDDLLSGRLFVVGDAKQSIYRFRRAEPRVFHELRGELLEKGRLPLSLNFRSQPQILAFVNAVFDGARGLGPEYEPLEAHAPQLSPVPCVEFLFAVNGADPKKDDEEDQREAAEDALVAARRQREADWIARRLSQLLTDGISRVRDRDERGKPCLRQAKLRDIAILFRAMSDVRYYEEALRKYGLDHYVVGGRAFFAQQEVFDVVNLCRWLDDPADRPALVGILRSPMFSLSDDTIFTLGRNPHQTLFAQPPAQLPEQQQDQVRFAAAVLAELLEKKDGLPIAQLLNRAIDRTGYDAALLTEFIGPRKLANLRKLVDMAREFDRSGLFTLGDFVDRLWDSVADEVYEPLAATHPESSNVIRLMSIHQSKGLEFPIVIVADCDRKSRDAGPPAALDPLLGPVVGLPVKFGIERPHLATKMRRIFEDEEELNESLRLFYVATTRAADHLILSANLLGAGVATSTWLKALAERFDLLTGQPKQAPTACGLSILAKYAGSLPEILVHHAAPEPIRPLEGPGPRGTPLSRLRKAVEQTEPAQLPVSLRVVPPDLTARRRFSVSEIETADQELQLAAGLPAGHGRRKEQSEIRNPKSEVSRQRLLFEPNPAPAREGPEVLAAAEQLGTLVHSALERLDFRNPQDSAALIESCCGFSGVRIDDPIRAAAIQCVRHILDSPLRDDLAGARQVHREIEFLLSFPPHTISGTIDCLFESSRGQWAIVDYKTSLHTEGTAPEELLAPYEIQLGLYALAVRELIQRLPDRIELVFPREKVERILFAPTESRLSAITARVHHAIAHLRNRN
jgi:ATP-dependent helicase/nuclease subunit A